MLEGRDLLWTRSGDKLCSDPRGGKRNGDGGSMSDIVALVLRLFLVKCGTVQSMLESFGIIIAIPQARL